MMIGYSHRTAHRHVPCGLPIMNRHRACLILLLITGLLLTACQPSDDLIFPELILESDHSDDPFPTGQKISFLDQLADQPRHLTVALPLGSDALELLRLYFIASYSGRLAISDDRLTTFSLTLEQLQIYDAPLELSLETVSFDTGATDDQLRRWTASASLPDLLYLDLPHLTSINDRLMDLTDLMAGSHRLASDQIYAGLLSQAFGETGRFGLPYLISTPLLFADPTFFTSSESSPQNQDLNWSDFYQLSQGIADELIRTDRYLSDELFDQMQSWPQQARQQRFDRARFVLAQEQQLIPWLPSQFDASLGWMAEQDGQWTIEHAAMADAWQWLAGYAMAGLGEHHLDLRQLAQAGLDRSEDRDERAVLWFDDSAQLTRWTRRGEPGAVAMLAPSGFDARDQRSEDDTPSPRPDQTSAPLPVQPRYLAVSQTSEEQVLAGQLALLLAADPAALILQSRIQLYEGFFPIVQHEIVWDMTVGRQLDGHFLSRLQPRLQKAPIIVRSPDETGGVVETMLLNSWEEWIAIQRDTLSTPTDTEVIDPSESTDSDEPLHQDDLDDLDVWLDQLNQQLSRVSGRR